MQGHRALLTGGDGVDGELLAGIGVAAHEDVRLGGLIGDGVGLHSAVGVEFHFRTRQQRLPLHLLADAVQHHVTGGLLGNGVVELGVKATLGVLHGQALAEADTGALAVLLHDLRLAPSRVDGDALALAFAAILLAHGHVLIALQAVQIHAVRAAAQDGAGHVGTDVAAADDHDSAAHLAARAAVHMAHEVDTGLDALCLAAGDVQPAAGLEAHGHIEALIALLTELGDGHILAHLHATAELHAHLPEDVDLRLHHVLLQAEAGDAVHQHAAGAFLLFKHGGPIALLRQIEGAAHTGRARADDGDLLAELTVHLGNDLLRHEAGGGVQILLGDEPLHLVDGHRLIHGTAGAGVLAPAVADAAAHGGERILPLDQLQSLTVLALGRQLQIALYGDVGGTGGLAGGGAGVVAVDPVLVPIVDGPLLRAPLHLVRQLLPGVFDKAVLGTQLLAQLHRAGGTVLHAAAAGHALLRLHRRHIGAAGHVWGVEQLAGAQGVAHVDVAVADAEDLLLAVDVGDLVDEAVVLGLLEDLHHLVIGDVLAPLGLYDIVGHIAHADAPVLHIVAAALAQLGAAGAAGAHALGVLALVLMQPIGDLLQTDGLVLRLDGFLHRDDVHTDARPSGRHHGGDLLQGQHGHPLEEGRHLGMLVDLASAHVQELGAAGDEQGQHPALFVAGVLAVQILPVIFQQAQPGHLVQQLFQGFPLHFGQLHHLGDGLGLADAHLQGHVHHLVGQYAVQTPVLRVVHGGFQADTVGDHGAQLQQVLPGRPVGTGDLEG